MDDIRFIGRLSIIDYISYFSFDIVGRFTTICNRNHLGYAQSKSTCWNIEGIEGVRCGSNLFGFQILELLNDLFPIQMNKLDVVRDYRKDQNYIHRSYQIILGVAIGNTVFSSLNTKYFKAMMSIPEQIRFNLSYVSTHGAAAIFLRSHQFFLLSLHSRFKVINALMRYAIVYF